MPNCLRRFSRCPNLGRRECSVIIALVSGFLCLATDLKAQANADISSESPEISSWIQQLSSPKFTERDEASTRLKRAGLLSIPELVKAARGADPEVTARAVECLAYLYESSDTEIAIAADAAMEQLLQDGPPSAAQRTEQAFAFELAISRRKNAIAAIESLGGIVVPIMEQDDNLRPDVEVNLQDPGSIQHVILGKHWKGTLASTRYLERLRPELRTVYVTSDAPLRDGELDLYRAALPQIAVEPRGGYLGISGTQFDPDRCEVEKLAPNSPARASGLQVGDRLTHLNGIPIKGFLSLTTLLLKCKSGETVVLDVLRHSGDQDPQLEELEIPVTLGEWGIPQNTKAKSPDRQTRKAQDLTPEKRADPLPEKQPEKPNSSPSKP